MNRWDQRYGTDEYVYGTEPNGFLVEVADRLSVGRTLCIADGEGRNSVYLAEHGHTVTAMDSSAVGMEKARKLAADRGVAVDAIVADLESFYFGESSWDTIVSIYCHLPHELRRSVHRSVVRALVPGGIFALEAYTPAQLEYRTGGPPTIDLLASADDLREELDGLKFLQIEEKIRAVVEGTLHRGEAAVVQILAVKPTTE